MRILIVDDDRPLRDALRRALVLGGYDTVSAGDGSSALIQVSESSPDAVVLDVGLPELNGVEVTREIRRRLPETEVLAFTGTESETTCCSSS